MEKQNKVAIRVFKLFSLEFILHSLISYWKSYYVSGGDIEIILPSLQSL